MNQQIILTEKEYRLLELDSYSTVKTFLDDRKKYYKKYILKEVVVENKSQESDDLRFGNLVDCLLLTPNEFDERYMIGTSTKPNGQMEDFVNLLYKLTLESVNENGDVTRSITELAGDAYAQLPIPKTSKTGKLRDSLEKFLERFLVNKEGLDYYMELRDRGDRILILPDELEYAHNVVEYISNHPYTRELIGLVSTDRYEVKNQMMLTGYIEGVKFKMMSDKVIFDHQEKIITPFDLKVMGNIDIFPYNYLRLKYYIQLAVYTTLLRQTFPDYEVHPLRFITVDKYRYMDPVIVKTTEADYLNAMNGFTLSDRKYTGLKEAINSIQFHKGTGIWTSTKEAQENGGVVTLKSNGEYNDE